MKEPESGRSGDRRPLPIAGLDGSLAELRELRDATRQKALTISFVIAGAALLLSLGALAISGDLLAFVLVPGIILAVVVYTQMMGGVRLKYKKLVVPALLHELDPGLSYNPSGYIPKEEFRRSKIFSQSADSYSGEDLVSGSYKGIPVRFSELNVQEKHSDGKHTTYQTFFNGVFMVADFNKDFRYRHWVLPDTAEAAFGQLVGNFFQKLSLPGRGHMTRMEDPAFEKKFVVYTEDDVEARYILTPKLMHTMLKLSERFRRGVSKIGFAFMNSNVYIAIPIEKGRDLFEMPSRGDLGAETARRTQEELKEILSVFDVMELDLRLWSKDSPRPNGR